MVQDRQYKLPTAFLCVSVEKTNKSPHRPQILPHDPDHLRLYKVLCHCYTGNNSILHKLKEVNKPTTLMNHRIMRKPTFCICENKYADQLRGNREADQRLHFRRRDSTIHFL